MSNKITVNETVNTVRVNETTNTITVQEASASVVKVITEGPTGSGVPALGDPGNIIIKSSYTNYDTEWSAVLDGGTFN